MKLKILFVILFVFSLISVVSAFDFNVTLKYQNGTGVVGANLTLTQYAMFPGGRRPVLFNSFSNSSVSGGIVYINNMSNGNDSLKPNNGTWDALDTFYAININLTQGGNVTYIGPILPYFPADIFQDALSGSSVFLEPAIGINITVYNSTNASQLIGRGIDITDGGFGNHMSASLDCDQNGCTDNNTIIYLPLYADQRTNETANYSFSVFGNMLPPMGIGFGPDKVYNSTTCDLNSTKYSAGDIASCRINGSISLVQVTGYFNASGVLNYTQFNGVNYLISPGNRIYAGQGGAFKNIGTFQMPGASGKNDTYDNNTGFFNVTVPGGEFGIDTLLMFFGTNNSIHYANVANVTAYLGNTTINISNINATTMYGSSGTFNVSPFGGNTFSIPTDLVTLKVSQSGQPRGLFSEVSLDYPNGNTYKWTYSPRSETGGATINIPIINGTTGNLNVFSMGTSPKTKKLTALNLGSGTFNISLNNFERKGVEGQDRNLVGNMKVEMYDYYNSSCDVPNPDSSCSLFDFSNASASDVGKMSFKVMMLGKANVKMTDTSTNTSVMYIGVNLKQSNAPPADFGNNATNDSSNDTGFDQLWKFGSTGPETYDYVYVSIPYNNNTLNDSAEVNVSIDNLYDTTSGNNWISVWNASSSSDRNASAVQNLSDYSATYSQWEPLLNGTTCISGNGNDNTTNSTNPCTLDNSSNLLYLRIPHFSGTGLAISGTCVGSACTTSTTTTPPSSGGGSGSGGGGGGSGGGTVTTGPTKSALNKGYQKIMYKDWKIDFEVGNESHTFKVENITLKTAKIALFSKIQEAVLSVGEQKKFDISGDNYYDVLIRLNSINVNVPSSPWANFTIQTIHEKIISLQQNNETKGTENKTENKTSQANLSEGYKAETNLIWLWILLSVIIVLVLIWIGYKKFKE